MNRNLTTSSRLSKLTWPLLAASVFLSGCSAAKWEDQFAVNSDPVVGPAVRDNKTPLSDALACYGTALQDTQGHGKAPRGTKKGRHSIGVGAIQDYTGRISDSEGAVVTQGGAPMLFSALHQMGDSVIVHERFDTRVAELELAYLDQRRLGDGTEHEVDGNVVPWEPYFGGSIRGSDYYIVGGITELNYNIRSGGAEFRINQIGPKSRSYIMNVAIDLRLVNTRTLIVESATSVQKQIVGYEVGFEIFRFFGSDDLFDVNIGARNSEPLQLGVRASLEYGLMQLLEDLTEVPMEQCLPDTWKIPEGHSALRETAQAGETVSLADMPRRADVYQSD